MVEPGTLNDVNAIVALGQIMAAESPRWSRLPYSAERVRDTLTKLIDSPEGLVLVAKKDGAVIGGILAICSGNWMSDKPICQELALFIAPEHRGGMAACRLISGMNAWAKIRGAAWCEAGVSTGIDTDRTAALYERLGFKKFSIGLER